MKTQKHWTPEEDQELRRLFRLPTMRPSMGSGLIRRACGGRLPRAGGGNRTRVSALEGPGLTTRPRPRGGNRATPARWEPYPLRVKQA